MYVCLCVSEGVWVPGWSVKWSVLHLPPLSQSLFIVCTLSGPWASVDSSVSTSCFKVGALGLQTQASMFSFYVGSADLNWEELGLLTCTAGTGLTEPSPQTFICSFRQTPVLCFLHWKWFRGLIHEQLWYPKLPGVLFLSPCLVGYQFLLPFFPKIKLFLRETVNIFENLVSWHNSYNLLYLTYFIFMRHYRNKIQIWIQLHPTL